MVENDRQADLVSRAAAGDELALTLLLKDSRRPLVEWIARKVPPALRSVIDADDVVQDSHVEAYRHVSSFEPRGPDAFDRWIRTIALRKLRDQIKRHRAAKRGGGAVALTPAGRAVDDSMIALLDTLAGPGRTPSRSVARIEAIEAVQGALNDIDEHYRQVIWMVHIEGRPVAEAARALGRTERAIHGLTRRGLEQLRERLGERCNFLSASE